MKILVVAKESQIVHTIKKAFKDIDADIEIIGTTKVVPDSFEQAVQESLADMILINHDINNERNNVPGINTGFQSTVTVATPSKDYTFDAFRIRKNHKENLLNLVASRLNELPEQIALNSLQYAHLHKSSNPVNKHPYRQRFFLKQGQRFHSIEITEISYFTSEERFIFLKTKENQKYLVEYRIDHLEKMLDPAVFFRVNRSLLVAISSIKQVHAYHGSRLKLILEPIMEKEVIVSRERVSDFKIWMGE